MATTKKSVNITTLDATPAIQLTEGSGAAGRLKSVSGFCTSSINTGVTLEILKLVRVPASAKVKAVYFDADALTQGTFDIGVYFSGAADGTDPALAGTALSSNLFGTSVSAASAVKHSDVTNESGTYTIDKRDQPLWQAAGWTKDPGGFLDIALTGLITQTAAGNVGLEVQFV